MIFDEARAIQIGMWSRIALSSARITALPSILETAFATTAHFKGMTPTIPIAALALSSTSMTSLTAAIA